MNAFLSQVKSNLQNIDRYEEVKMVVGNEACDLDSAISSLVYAYILHYDESRLETTLIVPLFNIKKRFYSYKTEVVYFLNVNFIKSTNLIFRDDIPWDDVLDKLKLVLVDHHVLDKEYMHFWKNVEEIIDHRPENKEQDYSHIKQKIIEPVGSCCTLIARIMLSKNVPKIEEISYLLYGTIIFDTICLKEEAQRSTELDKEVVEEIEKTYISGEINRQDIYDSIYKAKVNMTTMTTIQILHKDLKFLNSTPIPSIPMLIQDFAKRDNIEDSIKNFLSFNQSNFIIFIGAQFDDNKMKRDLGFYSTPENIKEMFLAQLLKRENELVFHDTISNISIYTQTNISMTRKAWIPIFLEILKRIKI